MNFEEAHDKLKKMSDEGAVTYYGPQFEECIRTRGHLEFGLVEMILFELQKEYENK